MMKTFWTLLGVSMTVLVSFSVNATTVDDQLIDALDQYEQAMQQDQLQTLQRGFQFETFASCADMSRVLEEYIKDQFDSMPYGGYGRGGGGMPMPMMADDEMMAVDAVSERAAEGSADQAASQPVVSESTDVSTTNLQVEGVDEPDILKTDGDYLYYYSQRLHKLLVIRSPLDRQTALIDLEEVDVVTEIMIPESFHALELYLQDDQLVLVGQRWRQHNVQPGFLDRNSRTDLIVYDIADIDAPKLVKFSDLDGQYHDSRMIGDTLYVVSQLHVNWYRPLRGVEDIDQFRLDEADLALPKVIDIAYTQDEQAQNLQIGERTFPYRVRTQTLPCDQVQYVLPTAESIERYGMHPSFSIVRAIDVSRPDRQIETTAAFGSTQTIHVSQQGLYLTSPMYVPYAFACPANAGCLLPWYRSGQHTLVHKFELADRLQVDYVDSTIVDGLPLSQYSMSEDAAGRFRILTKQRDPQLATHLFVLEDDLSLEGMLRNIEPGEEFKASRYMGDKLYLVTFERTDPLFVIDLEDPSRPKIIGELVIPGYSTYLHPYAPLAAGKQYLIGIGYDTAENERGGTITDGVKIDLYEVDYTSEDAQGHVSVEQRFTETWGEQGSDSEATSNPRMVVRDGERNLLVVPMILQRATGGEQCQIEYDAAGNEIGRRCRPSNSRETTFAGMKAIEIDTEEGISEVASYDYQELLMQDKQLYQSRNNQINPWNFQQLQFRVGYLGDVLYALNNIFGHFVIMHDGGQDHYEIFDPSQLSDGDGMPTSCTYTPPAPGEPVCEMYCGERWVVEDGSCVEVTINAACSCPGYSTKVGCEAACLE